MEVTTRAKTLLSWVIWALALCSMLVPSIKAFANPSPSPLTGGDVFSITNNSEFYDPTANGNCTANNTVSPVSGGGSTAPTSQQQITNAQIIIGIAKTEGLNKDAATIAVMVGLDESGLEDHANTGIPVSESNPNKQGEGSNFDSVGVFQQRVVEGWSTLATGDSSQGNDPVSSVNYANQYPDAVNQLMDVAYSAEAFFGSPPGSNAPNALSKGLQNHPSWPSEDPWVAGQSVQQSGTTDGSNYKAKYPAAQQIVSQYFDASPAIPLPVTLNGGGSAGGGSTGSSTAGAGQCVCGATSSDSTGSSDNNSTGNANPGAPTIVLDPGHATSSDVDVDHATDEPVFDYSNAKEQQQVWDLSSDLTKKLVNAGYNVLNTKQSEDDTTTDLKKRAEVGNDANAALGVSIHTTPGSTSVGNDVFVPVVGEYLVKRSGQHDVYSNQKLADTDKTYGDEMGNALQKTTNLNFKVGGYAEIYRNGITRVDPRNSNIIMKGTMLVTQYFATVPWLYLERYQDVNPGPNSTTVSDKGMSDYEDGILKGIEKIVPVDGGGNNTSGGASSNENSSTCGNGVVAGSIVQTALGLAWPDDSHGTTPTPAYAAALKQYNQPEYTATGGLGNDCGVFVATVMHASSADPNYPDIGTVNQANYVISHPNKYEVIYPATSTSQLEPGDILILNAGTTQDANGTIHVGNGNGGSGHTFIYVGPQQPHGYNEASASLPDRSAGLGMTQLTDSRGQYLIARLK